MEWRQSFAVFMDQGKSRQKNKGGNDDRKGREEQRVGTTEGAMEARIKGKCSNQPSEPRQWMSMSTKYP